MPPMMDVELNIGMFLDHAVHYAGDVEIVTRESGGQVRRYTYEEFGRRTNQLMNALERLSLGQGDVVATLAWNHHRHLEAYSAVPVSGKVLHTLNPRLSPDQLAYTIAKAEDRVILVDREFIGHLEQAKGALAGVNTVVIMDDDDRGLPDVDLGCNVIGYEDLIADERATYQRVEIPERSPCGICFTTGTTGRPKGVVYSHRSSVLHAMAVTSGAAIRIGPEDSVCAQVPMFHANCFGLPYAAMAVGAKQVLNAGSFDPAALVDLLISERVTFSAGVVTIWQMVAADLTRRGLRLPDLRFLITAGTQPPASLIEQFYTEFGIPMVQAYGMTESSPLVGVTWPKNYMQDWDSVALNSRVRQKFLPLAGVAMRLRDDEGNEVPWDGESMGHVQLRGPWIIDSYLGGDDGADQFTEDGYFVTGDVGIGSPEGYMAISDRVKDLVKSGGEWISSADMENAIAAMTQVAEAAVIPVPDPRWDERPVACVVAADDASVSLEDVHAQLSEAGFPRWQLPDRIEQLDALPRTSVGKVDKRALRASYGAAT